MKAPADNVEQIIENITSSRMRRIGDSKHSTVWAQLVSDNLIWNVSLLF